MAKRKTVKNTVETAAAVEAPAPVKEKDHNWVYFLIVVAFLVFLFGVL